MTKYTKFCIQCYLFIFSPTKVKNQYLLTLKRFISISVPSKLKSGQSDFSDEKSFDT